jgi:outer membrane protein
VFAHNRGYWKTGLSVTLLLAMGTTASAQSGQQKAKAFTLEEAVEFALKNYPAVRASLERVRAAEAGVGAARTSYLPRTDLLWQSNRATDNNISGLTIPNSGIAPITGPVPLSLSNRSAWGSAAGLLFSWERLDFGYRGARVDAARAAQNRATAEASLTRLDVSVATVNAYLTLLAAEQTMRSAQADIERRETFAKSVHVLVDNQLRAGAEASRADAELARARVNLARAQQQAAISRAQLADILGIADQVVEVGESVLAGAPPAAAPATTSLSANPFAQVQHARVQEEQSLVHALDRSYYPKLYLQSVVMGRGSGVDPTGKFLGGHRSKRHLPGIRHFLHQVEKSGGSGERTRRRSPLRSGAARPHRAAAQGTSLTRWLPELAAQRAEAQSKL